MPASASHHIHKLHPFRPHREHSLGNSPITNPQLTCGHPLNRTAKARPVSLFSPGCPSVTRWWQKFGGPAHAHRIAFRLGRLTSSVRACSQPEMPLLSLYDKQSPSPSPGLLCASSHLNCYLRICLNTADAPSSTLTEHPIASTHPHPPPTHPTPRRVILHPHHGGSRCEQRRARAGH